MTGKENVPFKDEEKFTSNILGHNLKDLIEPITDLNGSKTNKKIPKTKKCKSKMGTKSAHKGAANKSVKKRKRSSSTDKTDESIQMSTHSDQISDSDLLDTLSDILPDCDLWNQTELLPKEQNIERIVKEIHDESNEIENIQQDNDNNEAIIQESGIKVTILSSVTLTSENQSLLKTDKLLQMKPITKDYDLFTKENKPPKKRKKLVESSTKTMAKDVNNTAKKMYITGDTVLVRYKNTWKYYVGVIEKIVESCPTLYTVTFYKTICKKDNTKFVIPKRKNQDCVPADNIVKIIELLQINEFPEEYTILEDDDAIYF